MKWLKGHGILKCKKCGKIIMQCRCPTHSEIQYTICEECEKRGNNE